MSSGCAGTVVRRHYRVDSYSEARFLTNGLMRIKVRLCIWFTDITENLPVAISAINPQLMCTISLKMGLWITLAASNSLIRV